MVLQTLKHLISVHLRHHNIKEHHVKFMFFNHRQCLTSVFRSRHMMPLAFKMTGQQVEVHGIIINNEQIGAIARCGRGVVLSCFHGR